MAVAKEFSEVAYIKISAHVLLLISIEQLKRQIGLA